jgi:hypothetical protein
MNGKSYSSARITMLDRDSQFEQEMIAYPITCVKLLEIDHGEVKVVRTFIVDSNGKWVEGS